MQKNSEIRKDYFLDRYVVIAPKRNKRPNAVPKAPDEKAEECFFCPKMLDQPGRETCVLEKKDKHGKWTIKVVTNKFSALTLDNIKAYGTQEIVVETPEHNKEMNELPISHIKDILNVYIQRYNTLKKIDGISYVLVFKNEGGKAGASIPHSHSQIYALPMIPPKIASETHAVDNYIRENNSCPYCDIIESEKNSPRVIWEDSHLFVLAPFASESPYGAWFIPKRHIQTIADLNEAEKDSFAHALKVLLSKLDEIDVSYNYFFLNSLDLESHHMILKLAPRPNIWAGLELGSGIVINPVPPEEAVKFYQGK